MGAAPYAVLGYDYWRARFGGDPGVVGRTIRVSGYPLTVIGVARRGFKGTDPTTLPGLFVPLTMYSEVSREPAGVWNTRHYWWIRVIGRVPPGASMAALEARLTNIGRAQAEAERRENPRMGQRDTELQIALLPGARGYTNSRDSLEMPLLVLMAMVGAVLLIACANVANVLLARGAGRGRELAIRMAMGAGRGRLVSQLLTESLVMAAAGGVGGVILAWAGGDALLARFVPQTSGSPVEIDVSPDLAVLAFTTIISVITGVVAGLAPAVQASRPSLVPALKSDTAGAAGSSRAWLRRALVVSQVALSLLLVIGAALFARSLGNLQRLDPGFTRSRLAIASVHPGRNGYKGQRLHDFYERLREGVERVPGVQSASLSAISPLAGMRWNGDVSVEGYQWKDGEERAVDMNAVGPRFFETMGIQVALGREFVPEDNPAVVREPRERLSREPEPELPGPLRAVVNESFARKFLSGASPLGRRLVVAHGEVRAGPSLRYCRRRPGRALLRPQGEAGADGLRAGMARRYVVADARHPDARRVRRAFAVDSLGSRRHRCRRAAPERDDGRRADRQRHRHGAAGGDARQPVRRPRAVAGGHRPLRRDCVLRHAADARDRDPPGAWRRAAQRALAGDEGRRFAGRGWRDHRPRSGARPVATRAQPALRP